MSETTNLKLFKHDNPSTNENQFDVETALNDNWDKLDDYAGDVKDQIILIEDEIVEQEKTLEQIQQEDDQQDKDIESLQTKQTELETEIQELEQDIQSNAIIEETEQAKSLYITDASGARGSLSVEGNSEQEVQEGTDNLAILEDGTYTQNGITAVIKDGEASISGTATANVNLVLGTAYLIAGQTYYVRKNTAGGPWRRI